MGAAENADLVRRGYEAFNTADMETLTALFAEGAAWHTPGKGPLAGDRTGKDAVFGLFGEYGGQTAGTFRAELKQVAADDDGLVVGIHQNTGERDGKRLDVRCALVFKVEGGQIVDGREHFNELDAWDEFWS